MRTPQVEAPWSKHGAAEFITRLHYDGWYVSDQAGREVSGPFNTEEEAEEDIAKRTAPQPVSSRAYERERR